MTRGLGIQDRTVFRRPFDIPVRCINGSLRPAGAFANATSIHNVRVSLETVVQYASRYLFVNPGGGASPSTRFARDWKEILRWEIEKFWIVDLSTTAPKIGTRFESAKAYSAEHGKRSGEYMAYGFALAFIDRLLRIHPQRVLFFAASEARADFHLPIILPDGKRAGLEARSRGYFREPGADDVAAIWGKKSPSKVGVIRPGRGLVVYLLHGLGTTKSRDYGTQNQTQLFLVDPIDDSGAASEMDAEVAAVRNYLQLTQRIGLHHYSEILEGALTNWEFRGDLRANRSPYEPDFTMRMPGVHPDSREYGGVRFIGRVFSSLLAEGITKERAIARMASGDYGFYSFEGLAVSVLRLIALQRWAELASYSHYHDHPAETAVQFEELQAVVFGDGFCSEDLELDETHEKEIEEVKRSFGIT